MYEIFIYKEKCKKQRRIPDLIFFSVFYFFPTMPELLELSL